MTSEEQTLIARAASGETPAFNQLVLTYQQQVYNVALRILGDVDEAADAAQEAFISAFKSIKSYRGGQFKSWLFRICTNACYDRLRAKRRYSESSLDDQLDNENLFDSPNTLVPLEGPEDYTLSRELAQHLQAGLLELPADQRTALVLCDIQGMSYEEIAEIMNSSIGTVRSRISRGRAKMRDYLNTSGELLPHSYRP